MNTALSKEKVACPRSQRLSGPAILELWYRISSQKRKNLRNRFVCSYGAQVQLKQKWSKIS